MLADVLDIGSGHERQDGETLGSFLEGLVELLPSRLLVTASRGENADLGLLRAAGEVQAELDDRAWAECGVLTW